MRSPADTHAEHKARCPGFLVLVMSMNCVESFGDDAETVSTVLHLPTITRPWDGLKVCGYPLRNHRAAMLAIEAAKINFIAVSN